LYQARNILKNYNLNQRHNRARHDDALSIFSRLKVSVITSKAMHEHKELEHNVQRNDDKINLSECNMKHNKTYLNFFFFSSSELQFECELINVCT